MIKIFTQLYFVVSTASVALVMVLLLKCFQTFEFSNRDASPIIHTAWTSLKLKIMREFYRLLTDQILIFTSCLLWKRKLQYTDLKRMFYECRAIFFLTGQFRDFEWELLIGQRLSRTRLVYTTQKKLRVKGNFWIVFVSMSSTCVNIILGGYITFFHQGNKLVSNDL